MLKSMVFAVALLVSVASWGQDARAVSEASTLNARAALIHSEHPEAAIALTARATQVLTEPWDSELQPVEQSLVDNCVNDNRRACSVLNEPRSAQKVIHFEEFFSDFCRMGSPDYVGSVENACIFRDAARATLLEKGYHFDLDEKVWVKGS